MKAIRPIAIVLCLLGIACHGGRPPSGSLRDQLLSSFQKTNPRVSYVRLLDLRVNPESDSEYLLLATAGAPNLTDSIDFKNELFGVFVADSTLTHIKRTLDVFPSKRWHDYNIQFETTPDAELEVAGTGMDLGDQATHRVYDWTRGLIREYMTHGDSTGASE